MSEKGFWRIYDICRIVLLIIFGLLFVVASLVYNSEKLTDIFPVRLFTDQHIYQEEDYAKRERPDAYLRELIRYKQVYVPIDVKNYSFYNPIKDEDERGSGFVRRYYTENNYARYFKEYSKLCSVDVTLPQVDDVKAVMDDRRDDFTDMGIANDMLRYTFLLNKEHSKETKYFWYSWYYYSFAIEENMFPHIYIMKDSCEASDELAVFWDEGENLYVMGLSDYESSFKADFGEVTD